MSCDVDLTVWNRGNSVSQRIVQEVADVLGVDPLELEPLYHTISPDALDSLFQSRRPSQNADRVEFVFEGCTVEVSGTGKIHVTPPGLTQPGSNGGDALSASVSSDEQSAVDD